MQSTLEFSSLIMDLEHQKGDRCLRDFLALRRVEHKSMDN